MRIRCLATLGAVLLSGCVWEAPLSEPAFPIEYPIRHYVFKEDAADLNAWRIEVRAFRERLREKYGVDVTLPKLISESKEEQFLDRAVDPKKLLWRDPRYFFKTPVILSWWEVIDERGRVQTVHVIASNQTRETDAKIIAWCVNDKLWKPGEREGSPSVTIRSASINLGESRYHIHYWLKRTSPTTLAAVTLVVIGIPVWLAARAIRQRREARIRREKLMAHVAHKPYQAPSIDEPPRL